MGTTSVGIIIFISLSCLFSLSRAAAYGENCTDNGDCTESGQACINTTCACASGYLENANANGCNAGLGSTCSPENQCHDSYAECASTCTCKSTHFDDNGSADGGTCTLKNSPGQECPNPATGATGTCADNTNSDCSYEQTSSTNYRCRCILPYTLQGGNCVDTSVCSAQKPCSNGGTCTDGACTCAAGYTGETCTTDIDECTTGTSPCHSNENCNNNEGSYTCTCKPGYTGSATSCTDINECTTGTSPCHSNANCYNDVGSYTCTCKPGYIGDGKSCSDVNECTTGTYPCHSDATCYNDVGSYTCTCKPGYTGNGKSCSDIDECTTGTPCHSNENCNNYPGSYTCTCKPGYSDDGQSCSDINECTTGTYPCHSDANCDNDVGSYTCTCKPGYTGDGKSCSDINECSSNPCLNGGVCTNLINDFSCNCQKGFTSDTCAIAALGALCNPQQGTTCGDTNSQCVGTCKCQSSFYDDDGEANIGGTCLPRKGLGKTCTGLKNECADSGAACLNGKCYCGQNYYDTDGYANDGGRCNDIAELAVQTITFPVESVKTTEFMVSWTLPTNKASFVTNYEVSWMLKATGRNNLGSSGLLGSTKRSFVIKTNITPGRTYKVIVKSINALTHPTVNRVAQSSKEQAAKPNITSGIDMTSSERDASDGSIKIAWNAPFGYVSGYIVKLFDGPTELRQSSPSVAQATFFLTLKNGYRYKVTIQAESETYDNGKTVSGEIFTGEFKTTPKKPNPPENGMCKDPTDSAITVSWTAPAIPNGDIVRYSINVYSLNNTKLFNVNTSGNETEMEVDSLQPGTPYMFHLYTENEVGLSIESHWVMTACKTKAKMSEAPTSLQITGVTSRSIQISWGKPDNLYSDENYGYVLQIKDGDTCVKEMIYRCSSCLGMFKISDLDGMCTSQERTEMSKTKQELEGQLSYSADLNPDIDYTVTVTAINDVGRGHKAFKTARTSEEVPQKPGNIQVTDITTTSLLINWTIADPRPGTTQFIVKLNAAGIANSKEFTITGFEKRSLIANGLQEFWNYTIEVIASTRIGDNNSDLSATYQTRPAAPGMVSDFQAISPYEENYHKMKVMWKAPSILERNSIIKAYSFKHNTTEVRPLF